MGSGRVVTAGCDVFRDPGSDASAIQLGCIWCQADLDRMVTERWSVYPGVRGGISGAVLHLSSESGVVGDSATRGVFRRGRNLMRTADRSAA